MTDIIDHPLFWMNIVRGLPTRRLRSLQSGCVNGQHLQKPKDACLLTETPGHSSIYSMVSGCWRSVLRRLRSRQRRRKNDAYQRKFKKGIMSTQYYLISNTITRYVLLIPTSGRFPICSMVSGCSRSGLRCLRGQRRRHPAQAGARGGG